MLEIEKNWITGFEFKQWLCLSVELHVNSTGTSSFVIRVSFYYWHQLQWRDSAHLNLFYSEPSAIDPGASPYSEAQIKNTKLPQCTVGKAFAPSQQYSRYMHLYKCMCIFIQVRRHYSFLIIKVRDCRGKGGIFHTKGTKVLSGIVFRVIRHGMGLSAQLIQKSTWFILICQLFGSYSSEPLLSIYLSNFFF